MENQKIKTNEILEKVDRVIKKYNIGSTIEKKDALRALDENILPAMEQSKNTLGSLYKYSPSSKFGIIGKLKNFVLLRIRNIVINVMERESMRQQKQNDLTFQALQNLTKEIQDIKKQISKTN